MSKMVKTLLMAGCALGIFASLAQAAVTESAAGPTATPTVTSTTVSPSGVTTTTYSDGAKVLEKATPFSFSECPSGWVCLWENKEYGGRMLQFQSRGYWQALETYNFNNKTTGWANRTNDDAKLADVSDGSGEQLCMQPQSSNSQLTGYNDKASGIKIFTTNTVC